VQKDEQMSELTCTVGLQSSGTARDDIGAVASCYAATLFGVLRQTELPLAFLSVEATGSVSGHPEQAHFDRLAVCPTILGGDPARQAQYEAAAVLAYTRCVIANTLAREVTYGISAVRVREDGMCSSGHPTTSRTEEFESPVRAADEPVLAWRSGE
jgi:hypothetical protein